MIDSIKVGASMSLVDVTYRAGQGSADFVHTILIVGDFDRFYANRCFSPVLRQANLVRGKQVYHGKSPILASGKPKSRNNKHSLSASLCMILLRVAAD